MQRIPLPAAFTERSPFSLTVTRDDLDFKPGAPGKKPTAAGALQPMEVLLRRSAQTATGMSPLPVIAPSSLPNFQSAIFNFQFPVPKLRPPSTPGTEAGGARRHRAHCGRQGSCPHLREDDGARQRNPRLRHGPRLARLARLRRAPSVRVRWKNRDGKSRVEIRQRLCQTKHRFEIKPTNKNQPFHEKIPR